MNKNLTYVQSDGTVVLAVDDYTWLGEGQPRNSVRVSSKKTYNEGLFILDAFCKPETKFKGRRLTFELSYATRMLSLASLVDSWSKLAEWR